MPESKIKKPTTSKPNAAESASKPAESKPRKKLSLKTSGKKQPAETKTPSQNLEDSRRPVAQKEPGPVATSAQRSGNRSSQKGQHAFVPTIKSKKAKKTTADDLSADQPEKKPSQPESKPAELLARTPEQDQSQSEGSAPETPAALQQEVQKADGVAVGPEVEQAGQLEELRRRAQAEENLKQAQLIQQERARSKAPAKKAAHKQKDKRQYRNDAFNRGAKRGYDRNFAPRQPRIREHMTFTPTQNQGGSFEKPAEFVTKVIEVPENITVGDLAKLASVKAGDLIRLLLGMGVMKTINDVVDQDTATLAIEEIGHEAKPVSTETVEEAHETDQLLPVEGGQPRAAVITVMGHVDHGKTSLLDYIRKSKIALSEAGGITQHIGAYHVETPRGNLTFLDTPGHADFVAMRARGAKVTDLVVLVVAANDGVMPQTIEAINHARNADVPIVVAVNKMDLEDANLEKIKTDLAGHKLVPEDWGGDTQCVPISAATGEGVDELLESIALQAELLELKALADASGRGYVVESRLDKGSGPVASLLINNGTLKIGDIIVSGVCYGRIRAMTDEHRKRIKSAGASLPVEIFGLNGVPEVGDTFGVAANEKMARELVDFRQEKANEKRFSYQKASHIDLFQRIGDSKKSTLNIILKTDVRGSLEAIEQAIQKIQHDEVQANVIGRGVGGITESEALFAQTSKAVLFGFNVRADAAARKVVEEYNLDVRYYSVIYELIDDVRTILSGMLAPELSEEIVGTAEVRNIFNSQRYGLIAGCIVTTGSVLRNKPIRVLRDNVVIYKGELESLRRIKDDVEEVTSGTECGIGVKNYKDVRIGDVIETFSVHEVASVL